MTPARERALDIAADGLIRAKSALAEEAGCTTGVIDGLVTAGALVEVAIPEKRFPRPDAEHRTVEFHRRPGRRPSRPCASAVDGANFSVSLLDGVTGSGKTEVYFEAVARTLDAGRQALIMLPEIALTSQFMNRFTGRFGAPPVEWHSALVACRARPRLAAAATGEARVVVGARSALFLPYRGSRPDRRRRRARPAASSRTTASTIRRATWRWCAPASASFPWCSASATPSIESHVNARTGRYRHVVLPGRFSGVELPEDHGDRSAQRAAGQGPLARRPSGRGDQRDAGQKASNRCCSSIVAAMRR